MQYYYLLIVGMFVFVFILVWAVFKDILSLKLGNLPLISFLLLSENKQKHYSNNLEGKQEDFSVSQALLMTSGCGIMSCF